MDKEQATSVIGLRLSEARAVLESRSDTCALPIRVVETAPPARSTRAAGQSPGNDNTESMVYAATSREARKSQKANFKHRAIHWGEWRVLRRRTCRPEDGQTYTELLVAREELGTEELTQQDEAVTANA